MPADDRQLLYWVEKLFRLPADDVAAAISSIRALRIGHLTTELVERESADAAIGCYLLDHALAHLQQHVPVTKLLKKLRDDREVWPTWSELRVATMLTQFVETQTIVEMDPGRTAGAQPDLRVVVPDDPSAQYVEIKAVGLSDEEAAFCQRMAPSLASFAPSDGFVTVHSRIEHSTPDAPRSQRRANRKGTKKQIRSVLPSWPAGVSGASIIAHGNDADYMRRVALRLRDAARQLPTQEECWVAVHWTNGAPMHDIARHIRWGEIPAHVAGLILVGTGAVFPDRTLHGYQLAIPREAEGEHRDFESRDEDPAGAELGRLVLDVFERASGVRATLLRVKSPGGARRTLVLRDGSRRLSPFNLMLDRDLPAARAKLSTQQPR